MIDIKKKIQAARDYASKGYRTIRRASENCNMVVRDKNAAKHFLDGAEWAEEEFLKNLWHPASEEPKSHSYIIFKTTNNNGFGTEYIDCSCKILVRCMQITQWLYAEDLLPKEGGDGK